MQSSSCRSDSLTGAGVRDVQFVGNRLRLFAVEVEHRQGHPKLLGQPSYRLLQLVVIAGLQAGWPCSLHAGCSDAFLSAKKIDAEIPGNLQDPPLKLVGLFELLDPQKALEHGVLSGVLGVMDVSKHAQTQGEDALVVPFDQHGIGGLVAFLTGMNHTVI